MIHPADSFKGLNITINTTEDCNLRCKYCYETCKAPKTIDLDKCIKFIDIILDDPDPCLLLGTDKDFAYDGYIFDFIGGDSLMNVDILDKIMSYITTKMTLREEQPINGYRFSLSSNGTLFELPKVREFCEKWHENLSLGVSIDGCPEIHDLNRIYPDGRGSMETILKWWPWYQQTFPFDSKQTKSTCAKNSISYLYDSLRFMYEVLGIIYINQNFIMEDMGLEESDLLEFDKQMEKCIPYVLDHRKDFYWSLIDRKYAISKATPAAIEESKTTFKTQGWCGSGSMPALSIDGNIYPCFRWLPHTQNGQVGVMCVGNVNDGLTHKENFKQVSDCAIRCNCTKDPKCLECPLEHVCSYCIGGCYAMFGEFRRATYICEITKRQSKWAEVYWDEYDKLEKDYIL